MDPRFKGNILIEKKEISKPLVHSVGMTVFSEFPMFLKAIKAYRNNYSYFLRLRTHPELSLPERRLLDAKYFIKKKNYRRASEVLQALAGLPKLLEAHRKLLLADVRDGLALPVDIDAQADLCAALKMLGDESGYFSASVALGIELSIQGRGREALEALKKVESLGEPGWQRANWLRSCVLVHARNGDASAFRMRVKELEPHAKSLKPFHAHFCLTAIAYGLMLIGDLEESLKAYERILAKHRSSDIFIDRYWSLLLKTLIRGTPLAPTPAALRERELYFLRYNIVRSLQCGDFENAQHDWKRLQEKRPDHFDVVFTMKHEYLERTAFGRCIDKFLNKSATSASATEVEGLPPLVATLVRVLSGAPAPLRRPQLIEMLYHQPYAPSLDDRFYKLIQNAKKAGVQLKNRSGAYLLDSK